MLHLEDRARTGSSPCRLPPALQLPLPPAASTPPAACRQHSSCRLPPALLLAPPPPAAAARWRSARRICGPAGRASCSCQGSPAPLRKPLFRAARGTLPTPRTALTAFSIGRPQPDAPPGGGAAPVTVTGLQHRHAPRARGPRHAPAGGAADHVSSGHRVRRFHWAASQRITCQASISPHASRPRASV